MKVDRYRPEDLTGVYRVCLATGDLGEDASDRYADPNLLGHLYVGPYVALEPRHAFVLRDGARVAGYGVGARDTAAFEARCETSWWPSLRAMYPRESPRPDADAALVAMLHEPKRRRDAWLERYPSHLHIDLLPSAQGRGRGRALIETLLTSLFDAGSPGVFLGVARRNARAVGFYEHLGFTRIEERPDALILGRKAG